MVAARSFQVVQNLGVSHHCSNLSNFNGLMWCEIALRNCVEIGYAVCSEGERSAFCWTLDFDTVKQYIYER